MSPLRSQEAGGPSGTAAAQLPNVAMMDILLGQFGGQEGLQRLSQAMTQGKLTIEDMISVAQEKGKRPRQEEDVVDSARSEDDLDFEEDEDWDDRFDENDQVDEEGEEDGDEEDGWHDAALEDEDESMEEEEAVEHGPSMEYMGYQELDEALDAETENVINKMPDAVRGLQHFDVRALARRLIQVAKHQASALGEAFYPSYDVVPELVCGGVTQIGKTMFKVVLMFANQHCAMFTVIVTATVRNARALKVKINKALGFIEGTTDESCLHAKYIGDCRQTEKLLMHLRRGGCVVVNDTPAAIRRVIRLIQSIRGVPAWAKKDLCHRFVLIIDEADAMKRTASDQPNLKIEDGMEKLRGYKEMGRGGHALVDCIDAPSVTVSISATLIPIMLEMKVAMQSGNLQAEVLAELQKNMFICKSARTYQGVKDLFVARDSEGHPLFLEHDDLTHHNAYCFDNRGKVKMMLEDALQHPVGRDRPRDGVLFLFIANMRVTAQQNVHIAAKEIREEYPNVATVVVTGTGVTLTFPEGAGNGRNLLSHDELKALLCPGGGVPSIGDVLQYIDEEERSGLGMRTPVVVLGYSQMIRGDSFRSNERVPTHEVLSLGLGHSIDRMIQATGRATFNGREKLIRNGFVGEDEDGNRVGKTLILTQARDYDSAVAYVKFQDKMCEMLQAGCSLMDILSAETGFDWDVNFLGSNRRPIANTKRNQELRRALESRFNTPPLGAALGETYLRRRMLVSMPRHLMTIANSCHVTAPLTSADFKKFLQTEEFKEYSLTSDQLRISHLGSYLLKLWKHGFLERRRLPGLGSHVQYEYWDCNHITPEPIADEVVPRPPVRQRRRITVRGASNSSQSASTPADGEAEEAHPRRSRASMAGRAPRKIYPLAAVHLREQVLRAWLEVKPHLTGVSMTNRRVGKFEANMSIGGEKLHIGIYASALDAAIAYDEVARVRMKPVNFLRPGSGESSKNQHGMEWFVQKFAFTAGFAAPAEESDEGCRTCAAT
mmetsp:Transcript_19858/g.55233  ORF Transcript_19858/g.55233 Transcript_19858/m.55233 type:complete len:1002 (-) Transcript_19858:350-3355(-)